MYYSQEGVFQYIQSSIGDHQTRTNGVSSPKVPWWATAIDGNQQGSPSSVIEMSRFMASPTEHLSHAQNITYCHPHSWMDDFCMWATNSTTLWKERILRQQAKILPRQYPVICNRSMSVQFCYEITRACQSEGDVQSRQCALAQTVVQHSKFNFMPQSNFIDFGTTSFYGASWFQPLHFPTVVTLPLQSVQVILV